MNWLEMPDIYSEMRDRIRSAGQNLVYTLLIHELGSVIKSILENVLPQYPKEKQ
jgi:hypothetical protein